MTPRRRDLLIATIMLLAGAGLLAGSIVALVGDARFAAAASRATGTVVDLEVHRPGSSESWFPVVEFPAPSGPARFRGSVASAPPDYKRGEHVAVLYDPKDPAHAIIDSFGERRLTPVILAGVGAIVTLLGALLLRAAHRRA